MIRTSPIPSPDHAAADAARARQARLTKPPGSLGRLESLAVQLAALQSTPLPAARPAAALLFAADHPVTRHGVSPYPSSVTRAMVDNFARGGAAASVLSRVHRVPLLVVDVGVNGNPGVTSCAPSITVRRDPVADHRAGDLRIEDAMSEDTFSACLSAGRAAVRSLGSDLRILLLGEMGIGNTTAAAAVCAALVGGAPASFVGAGTGVSGPALENKRRVVEDAVARLAGTESAADVVRRVGGRDIAALLGAMLAAVETRIAVVVDGFIVTAAAAALLALCPEARAALVFAHVSDEQAHARVLSHLGAEPLLDLSLRLGEGSGALLALPLLEAACALHAEMATFESASVPDREAAP